MPISKRRGRTIAAALVLAGVLVAPLALAADDSTVQQLMRELEAMKRRLEKVEKQTEEQQSIIRQQSDTIRQLSGQKKVPSKTAPRAVATQPAATEPATLDHDEQL
jgi:septal ring factor EnvC (AmiA/AmiB activator)